MKLKPQYILDALGIMGAASIVFGVWQLRHAAAWILGGVFLLVYALLAEMGVRPRRRGMDRL